jgi:CdiI immunity protein
MSFFIWFHQDCDFEYDDWQELVDEWKDDRADSDAIEVRAAIIDLLIEAPDERELWKRVFRLGCEWGQPSGLTVHQWLEAISERLVHSGSGETPHGS